MRAILRLLDWRTQQRLLELRARFLHRNREHIYSYDQVAADSKHIDPAKVIDRLLRYQRCIGETISFEGKTVLEIGAGPLLGWALTGIALGAEKYIVLEPAVNKDLVQMFGKYFKQHRRYVMQTLGPVDEVEQLIEDGRIEIVSGFADNTQLPDDSVDLVISNSVLEHLPNLSAARSELQRITKKDGVQWHFVDLKDHQGKEDPFANLYSRDPDETRRMYQWRGLSINMLRAPDIITEFSKDFDIQSTTLLGDSSYPSIQKAHPYWREHYSPEELGMEVIAIQVKGRLREAALAER